MRGLLNRLTRKGLWLGIPAVVILVTAAFGGVALAHGIDRENLDSRVAEILEVDEQTVTDAIDDAIEEKAENAVQAWLDKLVENGDITQDQADEYTTWHADRPEWVTSFGFGKRGFHRSGNGISSLVAETLEVEEETVSDAISQALSEARSAAIQEKLAQAVEDGRLTQDEADEITEKIENGEFKGFRGHAGRGWKGGGWGSHRSGDAD